MAKAFRLYQKNLATELKELDVDRVDGVDRPATGRSFAVAKSSKPVKKTAKLSHANIIYDPRNPASVVKAMIVERRHDVRKSIYGTVLHGAIQNMVHQVFNDAGQPVGFLVKDESIGQSQVFKTAEEACSVVKGMLDRALNEAEDREDELDENGEMDPTMTHTNAGTATPIDDDTANADPTLGQRMRREPKLAKRETRKWNRL